jgi:hypothetical protein
MNMNLLTHCVRPTLKRLITLCVWVFAFASHATETNLPASAYHIYAGSTHAHTSYTWSHGAQFDDGHDKPEAKKESAIYVREDGVQFPAKSRVARADWQKFQGPPSTHFAMAKRDGYDFYITTDHSQDAPLNPVSATNVAWLATKQQAKDAMDDDFVALAGFEHSENNGPGGRGHINVINSAEYLNALSPGVDLPYLYKWLATAKPNGDGPVVAVFNHPAPGGYGNFGGRNEKVTDVITMLELINGHKASHYEGFIAALDHGWKVAPVSGHDNHGFYGIPGMPARTFVLATNKTKVAILDGMKHRRAYAALDKNIQCRYTVNGEIMGSTLAKTDVYRFNIDISDPDTAKPKNKITKIDIVKDHGRVVKTFQPSPAFAVQWSPTINDTNSHYFFVRVWSAGGGDEPNANPKQPVAWLAPVWMGR